MTHIPAGWQPIESAPKDGTEVLIYLGHPWSKVEKARWYAPWKNWQAGVIPADPVREDYYGIGSAIPTHWMPLPAAPGAEQDAGAPSSALLCAARAVVAADDAQALTSQLINVLRAACENAGAPAAGDALDDFASAGDNTLHGAIDRWQARAIKAEAALAAGDARDARDAALWRGFRAAIIRRDGDWLDNMGAALSAQDLDFDTGPALTEDQIDAAVDAAIAAQRQGDA